MSQHDASACELEEAKDKVKESINALRYTHFFKRFEYDSSCFGHRKADSTAENIKDVLQREIQHCLDHTLLDLLNAFSLKKSFIYLKSVKVRVLSANLSDGRQNSLEAIRKLVSVQTTTFIIDGLSRKGRGEHSKPRQNDTSRILK